MTALRLQQHRSLTGTTTKHTKPVSHVLLKHNRSNADAAQANSNNAQTDVHGRDQPKCEYVQRSIAVFCSAALVVIRFIYSVHPH